MVTNDRESQIMDAVARIEQSDLSASEYIKLNGAPFSIAQFYRYRSRLLKEGADGLRDGRLDGNRRKLGKEETTFLRGFVKGKEEVSPSEAVRAVAEEFGTIVHRSTMSRALRNLGAATGRGTGDAIDMERVSCAGFELVAAIALHLGWPEHTARCVMEVIETRGGQPQPGVQPDRSGRNSKGQFTKRYNQRASIRKTRFASIDVKRSSKDLRRMDIFHTSEKNLERKALAILALPLVTLNGQIRHVNASLGNALAGFCGYNYKQGTLERFLRELKYLGVSENLLCKQVQFWHKNWGQVKTELQLPFLCYYIDGNTKPVWSRLRVQQNKVTMWGRVMGCMEQMFVNDCFGRPIYFETYSGHGPVGVYTLSMMEKVEQYLQGAGVTSRVCRVLVMDGASNSVETLRAFAAQSRYHYITTLDDNQWSTRKVRSECSPQRYRWGNATVYDCEIELADSKEKGYLITVRALRVEWDYGKRTVLLTSLPAGAVGPSLVVKAYFDRWPRQELMFRGMKALASLHRVAGYGKQQIEDPVVREKQEKLQNKIKALRGKLKEPLAEIAQQTCAIAALIEQERVLRNAGGIKKGRRVLKKKDRETLEACSSEISRAHRRIKKIEDQYEKDFKSLRRCEAGWLRLQGKEFVYRIDVELDQILTYFRVSLANLCSYFLKEFLKMGPSSFMTLMQSVLLLEGDVAETDEIRTVVLKRNEKDPGCMEMLEAALAKLAGASLRTLSGKKYEFSLS
ncbi:MAG: helix-turn-helix domain-containing protein [Pirellulales bacterium]|jgi:transposase|nr:helix-turn-helix domain-containing protein [Pirellulales bacterium]|tara:strand:+ start:136 stop:2355 length:2220 start_codon:yes stop_codon:yes gene_type:complete